MGDANGGALEFADGAANMEQQAAGRAASIDELVEDDEVHLLVGDLGEVADGAGEAVEPHHRELVTFAHEREAFAEHAWMQWQGLRKQQRQLAPVAVWVRQVLVKTDAVDAAMNSGSLCAAFSDVGLKVAHNFCNVLIVALQQIGDINGGDFRIDLLRSCRAKVGYYIEVGIRALPET